MAQRPPKTLAIWAVVFLLLPVVLNFALAGLVELGRASMGEQAIDAIFAEQLAGYEEAAIEAEASYRSGSYTEVTAQRITDMWQVYLTWPFFGFNVLAAMLIGMFIGRRGYFDDVAANRETFRRALIAGLMLGVAGNALYVVFGTMGPRAVPSVAGAVAIVGQTVGAPALGLSYIAGLTLLSERDAWQPRLAPLADVGRMALTNYILQSVFATFLFFGYGLGLYGTVGFAAGIGLTLVIYAANIALSVWWLRRFRFGPLEWLWRSLTYGRPQPLRPAPVPAP